MPSLSPSFRQAAWQLSVPMFLFFSSSCSQNSWFGDVDSIAGILILYLSFLPLVLDFMFCFFKHSNLPHCTWLLHMVTAISRCFEFSKIIFLHSAGLCVLKVIWEHSTRLQHAMLVLFFSQTTDSPFTED